MAGLRDTDTAERVPDFDEGMRAAEEAAGIPSDAELYGEAFQAPEADEAGRVPASRGDDVIEDAPAAPAEEAAPADEPASEADPVPDVVPVVPPTDELAELKRKVGQMANENAELRRWQEEQTQAASQQTWQPDGQALAWFDEIVDQAPDQAAVWAAQQNQPLLYERAIRSWFDVDPVAAQRYERSMEWGQLQNQMEERFAPQIKGAQELSADADRQAAFRAVAARHDDLDEVLGGMTEEKAEEIIVSGFPTEVLPSILNGSREGTEKALETLYRFVKSEQAPALVQSAVEAVSQGKEDARAAKLAATVASSTVTTPDPVEESEGERLSRVWKEGRPNMRDAWTGR